MMRCFAFFASWDCPLRAHVLPLDVMRRRLATAVDELADDLVAALEFYERPQVWRPMVHARYMNCLWAITQNLPTDLVPPGKVSSCHQWWITGGRVDEALIRAALQEASGTAWYLTGVNEIAPTDYGDWATDRARMRKTVKLLRRCNQAQGMLRQEERRSLLRARAGKPQVNFVAYAY